MISPENLADFRIKYKKINTAGQLQSLLNDLTKKQSFLKLSASLKNNAIEIEGVLAPTIEQISTELTTRTFKSNLEAKLRKYIGLVNSSEINKVLLKDTQDYLKTRGFYKIKQKIDTIQISKDLVRINIEIDEGFPCRIEQIQIRFNLSKSINFGISKGDICDRESTESAIEELKNELNELGYNNQNLLEYSYEYNAIRNSAILKVLGDIGKKIYYEVINNGKGWSSKLNEIDASITDPDVMTNELIRNYKEAGFSDAEIIKRDKSVNKDSIKYIFTVKQGTKYTINDVQIENISVFSLEECLEQMNLQVNDSWSDIVLNQERIQNSVDSLTSMYQSKGYWDIKVKYPRILKSATSGITRLVFVVQEGKQRVFNELILRGNKAISDQEIKNLSNFEKGKPITWEELIMLEKKILLLYRKKGYIYTSISINLLQNYNWNKIETKILLEIDEKKRVKIGDITITGLITTKRFVVSRELRFQTNDWYNPELIEETRKALLSLGLFSSVSIIPSDSSNLSEESPFIPYTILLVESKPGTTAFGPGWTLYNGARFQLEASYNNWGGIGRQIFFKGAISEEKGQSPIDSVVPNMLLGRKVGLGLTEPYIFRLPVNASALASHSAKSNYSSLSETGAWTFSNGAEGALTYIFRNYLYGSKIVGFYGQKIDKIDSNESQDQFEIISTGNIRSARLGIRFESDQRNNIVWPTKGFKINSEFSQADYALGGDLGYFKWDWNHTFYKEIIKNWAFAVGYNFTAYSGIKNKAQVINGLPFSERLFAGGSDSNRGFGPRELGPIFTYYDSNTNSRKNIATGGSKRSVYKSEIRYQFSPGSLAITAFVDSSNVFFTPDEKTEWEASFGTSDQPSALVNNIYYDFSDLLQRPEYIFTKNFVSFGLALKFLTAVGSIDISYGIPLEHLKTEDCDYSISGIDDLQSICTRKKSSSIFNGNLNISVGADF